MRPTVVQPPNLSGSALAELKAWLGISRPKEDELLTDLLHTSLEACEQVLSEAILSKTIEEQIPAQSGWHSLSSSPIRSLAKVEVIAADGLRTTLADQSVNLEIDTEGYARFHLEEPAEAKAFAIQVHAGAAMEWADLPPTIKQGIIRLAAFYFRERDQVGAKQLPLPASIASLWRPWRKLRLS